MIYSIHPKRAFFTLILYLPFITMAQTAKLSDIFNGEMLGVSQRYFESVAGIPRKSFLDTHTFRVQDPSSRARAKM